MSQKPNENDKKKLEKKETEGILKVEESSSNEPLIKSTIESSPEAVKADQIIKDGEKGTVSINKLPSPPKKMRSSLGKNYKKRDVISNENEKLVEPNTYNAPQEVKGGYVRCLICRKEYPITLQKCPGCSTTNTKYVTPQESAHEKGCKCSNCVIL